MVGLFIHELVILFLLQKGIRQTIEQRPFCETVDTEYLVLIPVYKEAAIIKSTLEYFDEWASENLVEAIYIITTEKEEHDQENTTKSTVKKYIEEHESTNVELIHYPHKKGGKAHQVNYAVDYLDGVEDYEVILYDADSRPEEDSLQAFETRANYPVEQQYPIYTKGIPPGQSAWIANALYQTRRTFFYEIPNTEKQLNGTGLLPHYVIGHGLCVDGAFLEQHPLPEDTLIEDLEYGYQLDVEGTPVAPTYSFDICEMPESFSTVLRQASVWMYADIASNIRMYKDRPPLKPMLKSLYLLFWATRTFLYGFSLLTLLFITPWIGILSVASLAIVLTAQLQYLNRGLAQLSQRTFSVTPSLIYHYIKRTVLDSLPGLYLCLRLLRTKLCLNEQFYDKTKRNDEIS
jgi:cellulose synthase/poly-beta-1,6-N-acetylglucosamine synthase-like glycosyltransferase